MSATKYLALFIIVLNLKANGTIEDNKNGYVTFYTHLTRIRSQTIKKTSTASPKAQKALDYDEIENETPNNNAIICLRLI